MPGQIIPIHLLSKPGVKRDGTALEGDSYTAVQWARFQRGLPRKMGGYRRLTNLLNDVGRGMNVFDQNNETYTHVGYGSTLQQFMVDPNGVVSGIFDRTPAGFTTSANNLWQFDTIYDGSTTSMTIIATAPPNALDISSDTTCPVYVGSATGSAVLTATTATPVSGGVVVIHPYAFAFGSNGVVYWSVADNPNDWSSAGSGNARVTSAKVVAGMPLRSGAGNAPSGLFWTLDHLIRATFVGTSAGVFQFDTITVQSSILSQQSIIEYDGIYFWVGIDRFLLYNGVVRELPNNLNINYFFDNLNYAYRQRVFAYKVPRFGEIWWCYPRGTATECTHAVIYNVREDLWYDTELPNSGRSCGQYAQVFRSPLMTGVNLDSTAVSGGYRLWQHEFGVDEVDGAKVNAVSSYFETAEFGLPVPDNEQLPNSNKAVIVNAVEPDFVQTGDMTLETISSWNARSPEHTSTPYTFADTAATPAEEIITIRETGRYMRFRFTSNVQGGDYQTGKVLMHIQEGGGRLKS